MPRLRSRQITRPPLTPYDGLQASEEGWRTYMRMRNALSAALALEQRMHHIESNHQMSLSIGPRPNNPVDIDINYERIKLDLSHRIEETRRQCVHALRTITDSSAVERLGREERELGLENRSLPVYQNYADAEKIYHEYNNVIMVCSRSVTKAPSIFEDDEEKRVTQVYETGWDESYSQMSILIIRGDKATNYKLLDALNARLVEARRQRNWAWNEMERLRWER